MELVVSSNILLQLTAPQHAEDLLHAVNQNREHLSAFLSWVPMMQTVEDFANYISNCEALYEQQKELSFVIFYKGSIAGRIGLHYINNRDKNAAIGYWLIKPAEGRGIVTQYCKALIEYAFTKLHLQRIEIKAATQNIRSQAIPEKLGFTREGVLRQAEMVNGQFVDLVLYSMLKKEWR